MSFDFEFRGQPLRWCGYLLCGLLVLGIVPAYADSTVELPPTSASNIPVVAPWTPSLGTLLDDVSTALDFRVMSTAVEPFGTDSLYLTFPISIPSTATVDGIEFTVEGYGGALATTPVWATSASINGGSTFPFAPTPGSVAISATTLPEAVQIIGGTTDDWGGLTAADVNSAGFGIEIYATDLADVANDTYFIDQVQLKVYWTPAIHTSDQDGPWADPDTWDLVAVPGVDERAIIAVSTEVTVDTTESAAGLSVSGTLNIDSVGDLTSGPSGGVSGGVDVEGLITNSGSFTTTTGTGLGLGPFGAGGFFNLPGSTLSIADKIDVGAFGTGVLGIAGSATVMVGGDLNVDLLGGGGIIVFEPTANGSAGLGGITCADLTLGADSTLTLDTSSYFPSLGDSWDVITLSGTQTGTFTTTAIAGPGAGVYELALSSAKAGTVTATIVFSSSLPSTTNWGLIVLLTSLSVAGAFALYRIRKRFV